MDNISTTRMSSKGQVVIPEEIRERLGLAAGVKFVVVGDKDTVILKMIQPPAAEDVEELLASARRAAKKAGAKKTDIDNAIKKARAKK
ncbi:transcriptional regulator, AbrB family (plasmid) [Piscirickettsia salmonis]|uniref:AbrB/MazE/SpoVT family DNA-binding domain-containing protein n=1 Tax=Piscirickettsia salmonis TaxID=1238 RepID=UPI0012B7DB9B|nr:AbrB/MazE/SpoVT family DNA-binding domain-containing protein [Piscirickettsia salmonis]QGP52545.1 transcriptional regulator, AbrB family [Piscirickettsia salmonis]